MYLMYGVTEIYFLTEKSSRKKALNYDANYKLQIINAKKLTHEIVCS